MLDQQIELSPAAAPVERPAGRGVAASSGARVVWIGIVVFILVMGGYALMRHYTAYLGDADYSEFEQGMWCTTHYGLLMHDSVDRGSHYAVHVSPVFQLMLPVYVLFPSITTLIVIQTVGLGLGAWPLYLLARRWLPEKHATGMAIVYLMYHPLHGVAFDQISNAALATPAYFAALYCLDRRRWGGFWAATLLALSTKEDQSFVVICFGLYLFYQAWRHRSEARPFMLHGLGLIVVGLFWAWCCFSIILPHYQAQSGFAYFIVERYAKLGHNLGEVIHTLVTRPDVAFGILFTKPRMTYLPDLLAPLFFLPVFSPALVLVAAPDIAINMLSSFAMMYNTSTRYPAPIIPFAFVSALATLSRMPEKRRNFFVKGCLAVSAIFMLAITPAPPRIGFHMPPLTTHDLRMHALAGSIPEYLNVATQDDIMQYSCHRLECSPDFRPQADVVFVDRTRPELMARRGWNQSLPPLLTSGQWEKVLDDDGFLMLVRKGVKWRPSLSS